LFVHINLGVLLVFVKLCQFCLVVPDWAVCLVKLSCWNWLTTASTPILVYQTSWSGLVNVTVEQFCCVLISSSSNCCSLIEACESPFWVSCWDTVASGRMSVSNEGCRWTELLLHPRIVPWFIHSRICYSRRPRECKTVAKSSHLSLSVSLLISYCNLMLYMMRDIWLFSHLTFSWSCHMLVIFDIINARMMTVWQRVTRVALVNCWLLWMWRW